MTMQNGFDPDHVDLEQLYEETVNMIYNLGLRLFKDEEEAKDFTQDVYMKAFAKLNQFNGKSKFSTWLYSLGLHLGLNKLRQQKKKIFTTKNIEEIPLASPEDHVEQLNKKEQTALLQKKLHLLPETYRLPLILFFYEGMPYAEIASSLNIKEGTIKSNIHRGKKMLRALLEQEEQNYET